MHEFFSVHLTWCDLSHAQIVLVNDLNGNVNSFARLLEFDSHLVNAIDDALAALYEKVLRKKKFKSLEALEKVS